MNTAYIAQDDFQLFEDAVANVPGARTALQARIEELPAATAELVTSRFIEATTAIETTSNHPLDRNKNMGTFEYAAAADFGIWTRAVDRVVEVLDLDYYPSEVHVAEIIAQYGLTNPDEGGQMEALEDELIILYS